MAVLGTVKSVTISSLCGYRHRNVYHTLMIMNLLCCGRTAEGKENKREILSVASFRGLLSCPAFHCLQHAKTKGKSPFLSHQWCLILIIAPYPFPPSYIPLHLPTSSLPPFPLMLPKLSSTPIPSHLPWFHPTSSGFSVRSLLTFIDGCHGYVSTTHSLTSVHSSWGSAV